MKKTLVLLLLICGTVFFVGCGLFEQSPDSQKQTLPQATPTKPNNNTQNQQPENMNKDSQASPASDPNIPNSFTSTQKYRTTPEKNKVDHF